MSSGDWCTIESWLQSLLPASIRYMSMPVPTSVCNGILLMQTILMWLTNNSHPVNDRKTASGYGHMYEEPNIDVVRQVEIRLRNL